MKARLYFAAVLFFMPSRVRKPHTDPTDPTGFARLMLNLAEVSLPLLKKRHLFNPFKPNLHRLK